AASLLDASGGEAAVSSRSLRREANGSHRGNSRNLETRQSPTERVTAESPLAKHRSSSRAGHAAPPRASDGVRVPHRSRMPSKRRAPNLPPRSRLLLGVDGLSFAVAWILPERRFVYLHCTGEDIDEFPQTRRGKSKTNDRSDGDVVNCVELF